MASHTMQPLKGMKDCPPSQTPAWQYIEATLAQVVARYAYEEIRFPLLDRSELFKRSIGEVTDIVEKEMYTFADRDGESISLRPEGTACCVRACEAEQLLYNRATLTQKLWYMGPMFRHERPQKGRLRQFHQIGLETFGFSEPDIEAELIRLTADIWEEFGIADSVHLQVNCIGNSLERARFKKGLVEYLTKHTNSLDEDSQRRLDTNPMRILDSKDAGTQAILQDAPQLENYLSDDSRKRFASLLDYLTKLNVDYSVNRHLVRGLDYYNDAVFEWVSDKLGAQATVCGGGRYDTLVEQLGGKPTPAFGFGMGLERLLMLLEETQAIPQQIFSHTDVYIMGAGVNSLSLLQLAAKARCASPQLRIETHLGGGSFKSQMKKADKSQADIALILGESELANNEVTVKFLRDEREQLTITQEKLSEVLQ